MADNFAAGKTAKSEQTRKRIIHTFLSLIDEKNGIRSPSKNFVRAQRSHAALFINITVIFTN